MPRRTLASLFVVLATAPATAEPVSLHCDRAVHVWCDGGTCGETEVTPFVLVLDGAAGQIETCQGEHCESGTFTVEPEWARDARRTLLFGQALLEAHPLSALFNGRVYGLTVDTSRREVSLSRIVPGSISVLQVASCTDWAP